MKNVGIPRNNLPRMRVKRRICIQPFGEIDALDVLERLKSSLQNLFDEVLVKSVREIPTFAYNPVRRQYNSTVILQSIKMVCDINLGFMQEDIYSSGLNFVFGEAELGGRRALISIHRLKPEFYGMEEDRGFLNLRTLKEAIHEIGHVLGLRHCSGNCVMSFSNSIADTDAKDWWYCKRCIKKLSEFKYL